ncbi:MAG: FAD-dependent oxidoreductase [Deinococcota bacterium]
MNLQRPFRVAVVGAGPSGFYAAEALVKNADSFPNNVSIDIFDRLPTPYGLVRYGVAPDHQKIKSVTKLYERVCKNDQVRFLGHVRFGKDIHRDDLKAHYDAIIYTVGAPSDRNLNIPGEDLTGSLSATTFVAWYNAHPDYAHLDMREHLAQPCVAVIGMGNVAVDVTRILAKSVDELKTTDIADHALAALAESNVTDIVMLGRRGPAQAKFTTKELRELGELANADIVVNPADLELDEASEKSLEQDPMLKKNVEILREFAAKPQEGKPRRVHLRFLVSPKEVQGEARVDSLVLERNRLEPQGDYMAAVGTGETEVLGAGVVLRSVGYRGVPLTGVPFDARRAVIPNDKGRVLAEAGGVPLAGEYVSGWIKRGPTGVIGTNKADSTETIAQLLEDLTSLPYVSDAAAQPEAVDSLLAARQVRVVTFDDWLALDKLEKERGQQAGRPRVKVAKLEEMLEHCSLARSS